MTQLSPLLDLALNAARQHGADHADVIITHGRSRSAMVRQGKAEGIKHAEALSLGLRVFHGKRFASVSGNDLSPNALNQLAERACSMARLVPESPYDGLADNPLSLIDETAIRSLDLLDPTEEPDISTLLSQASEMEAAALSFKNITNSSGASASAGYYDIALATSAGFRGQYQRSQYGLGISVLAGSEDHMERDYAVRSACHQSDLPSPASLGKDAAQRTLARLNSVRPKTGQYPVIFDRRIASSILGHLAAAINGTAIVRGTSFLKERMGQQLFPETITISDDPTRPRGLGSRPFDGEGCSTPSLDLISHGILSHWLLDSRCARQLGLSPNGRATRSLKGSVHPGTSNLFLHPGSLSVTELFHDIHDGIFITELMGNAVNMLTGDYSRGASGFMIRNGQIAEPLSGFTVAGNLRDMFAQLRPANDLCFEQSINTPTFLIDHMTIAGQ
ncbi:TldD/PmbA family protein [Saccharibacter sp. 17.LH.SD]|uniref:TldD/PmbA family protein n=1 Tax=Saccharibacter sp. 17.LH.SD TaxID=2689393 RepID=UPI001369D47C|nr:TldD/PmbA family protein [Saccharibacter sp. 17.LH.SD]MXV44136.1 TldD/PmbA family protein [Saccharibacter sp. 17.LH.SD]